MAHPSSDRNSSKMFQARRRRIPGVAATPTPHRTAVRSRFQPPNHVQNLF